METKEKKQVVSAIAKATNILVTVGVDPTVDELSALLGLSLILGKLDKHATAVFSGRIPAAISFLEPEKTIEDTVDGLRDFIIELNKDKADHLRYKLDGDVVKIFITPYKNTIIRDTDLQFSQGDFNVELILALGVENKADLDTAVSAHGRILHDATTITLTSGSDKSDLGEIDWHAGSASSLCEMLVALARDLGENLLDEHIATALLTGIVSNTERFSNNLTTSDVMKTAATLMAAGANQQLIAARLEPEEEPTAVQADALPIEEISTSESTEPDQDDGDGTMQITHDGPSLVDIERDKDQVLQDALNKVIPSATVDLDDLIDSEKDRSVAHAPSTAPEPRHFVAKATGFDELQEPSMGGTLNATTEQAEEDSRAAIEDDRNHVILSHDAPPASVEPEIEPAPAEPVSAPEPPDEPEQKPAPVQSKLAPDRSAALDDALESLGYPAGSHPTLADLDHKAGHDTPHPLTPSIVSVPGSPTQLKPPLEVDDARAAVATALDSAFNPANNPIESVGSQPLGEELHSAPLIAPIITPSVAIVAPVEPASTAISLPPLPPLPPLPGQSGVGPLPPLPPLPDVSELDTHEPTTPVTTSASAAPNDNDWQAHTVEPPANDPGQFHIPGQK